MGKENNSRQKAVSRMMFSGSVREIGVFVALIIMVIIFALIDSSYVTVGNFVDIVKQATINGILAIVITFAPRDFLYASGMLRTGHPPVTT